MLNKSKKLVLVVDDDIHIREAMAEALEYDGFDVVAAVDGQDALEKLSPQARLPDAVIIDLLMPRINGWELRHRLHTEERLSSIPVIVLSSALNAQAWPKEETPAGELKKPPVLETLLKLVHELIVEKKSDPAGMRWAAKES